LLLPVDRVLASYNLTLGIAFIPIAVAEPRARLLVVAHLFACCLPVVLARCGEPRSRTLALMRELYPLLCLALFWSELGVRYSWVNTNANDALVARLELLLFGFQPSVAGIGIVLPGWLDEAVSAWYASYYVLLIGIPLLLIAGTRGRGEAWTPRLPSVRDLVFRMTLTYLVCFTIYVFFPVAGPREFFAQIHAEPSLGWFGSMNESIRDAGDSLGTAFPSSHVAGSITLAWIAWRSCPRVVAWSSAVIALGMSLAVVYTRNHFALDALAAVALAIAVQQTLVPVLQQRWCGEQSSLESVAPGRLAGFPAEVSPT
jgi:membrane-associated phospholipid phosphatase